MAHIKTEILTFVFDQLGGQEMEISFQRIPDRLPSITVVSRCNTSTVTVGKGDLTQADLDALLELAEEWNS